VLDLGNNVHDLGVYDLQGFVLDLEHRVFFDSDFFVSSLRELFDMVNTQNILGFIRDIGLYCLLFVNCNLSFICLIHYVYCYCV